VNGAARILDALTAHAAGRRIPGVLPQVLLSCDGTHESAFPGDPFIYSAGAASAAAAAWAASRRVLAFRPAEVLRNE
jgi:hypothetical protein